MIRLRTGVIVVLGAILASSCTTSQSPVQKYQVIRKDLHLGEYLQIENPNSLITVNRSAENPGLVRVNLSSQEISVLDSSAREARDLRLANDKIAYRVGSELRLWIGTPVSLATNAQKLRTFHWLRDFGRLTYETLSGESRWMSIRADGKIISEGPLPGSGRSALVFKDREQLIFDSGAGLSIGFFGNENEGILEHSSIEAGVQGDYVAAKVIGETLFVAYLDGTQGVLRLAKKVGKDFAIETIDGNPGKTYRGMDIALFEDNGQVGLVYLDAWALKICWARLRGGVWVTEQLPIQGAVGFYNQILEQTPTSLTIAFHNFRSLLDNYEQSFEDLAVLKLAL